MNPLWQRAQELQRAINSGHNRGGEGRLFGLYLALGGVREQLASERLASRNAQGWVDRLAAITAYARAGASVRAGRLWSASRAQAEAWPTGGGLLVRQHDELETFPHKQALEPAGISLPGATSPSDVDHVLRLARAYWPDGVIDAGDGRGARRLDAALKSRVPVPSDFSLHETMDAHGSWAARAEAEADDAQMMLVVFESDKVCFTAGGRAGKTDGLARDMVAALKANRWLAHAPRWPAGTPKEAA